MTILQNVQGIVAQASSRPLAVILLFRIVESVAAKRFLSEWTRFTLGGLQLSAPNEPILHFAFSWLGLECLLRNQAAFDVTDGRRQFEWAFTDPEQAPDRPALSEQLGFLGGSDPQYWWNGAFTTHDIHIAVLGFFASPEQKGNYLDRLRASASKCGLEELRLLNFADEALSGYRPADGRLHFGYRDGITSPPVDWDDTGDRTALVDLREFVVGYPTRDYPTTPQYPGPWQDFARDGSYVGLTWIYQDVAGFNTFLSINRAAAPHADAALAEEWLAAKLMGRWRDGSPLTMYPDRPPPLPQLRNDFGYANDPRGVKCPLAAHIRVTNSRDQALSFPNQSRFPQGPPRLIRRGFSYGPPLTGCEDDSLDRGLIGVFFCARLNEQFYSILRWMQRTDFSDAFGILQRGFQSQDLLLGNRSMPSANTEAHLLQPNGTNMGVQLTNFIRFRGVVPLFAPSIGALGTLSATQ